MLCVPRNDTDAALSVLLISVLSFPCGSTFLLSRHVTEPTSLTRMYHVARSRLWSRRPFASSTRSQTPGMPWAPRSGPHFPSLIGLQMGTDDALSASPSGRWHLSVVVPGPRQVSGVSFAPAEASVGGGACDFPPQSCGERGRPGHVHRTALPSQRTSRLVNVA